ncbi:DUF349 domain-containing protein [Microbacterium sp. A93]|uniref:DUF349 domain-containing protein n=1 Tax=Microbacterium sp. A93 TaxID=3450716 RepID=UPI003F41B722
MTTSQESDDQQSTQSEAVQPDAPQPEASPVEPVETAQAETARAETPAEVETEDVLASVESVEAPAAVPAAAPAAAPATEPAAAEAPAEEPASPTPAPVSAVPAAPKPAQTPTPGKAPKPSNLPRPGGAPAGTAGKPGQASPKGPAAPMPAPSYTTSPEEAARFATISDDGHVVLLDGGEEHPVGQFPDGTPDEALAYFSRKYDEVVSQVMLLEQRVASGAPAGEIQKTLGHLRQTIGERGMVGDMQALRARVEALQTRLDDLKLAEKLSLEKAQAEQLATREAIVAEAEEMAAQDPQQVQWKHASARMAELFENWKAAQKAGPRLGKSVEDGLWKRFRTARTTHDKHRRAFFSQLDATNATAKQAKEKLIARAEALSSSTDWGPTAGAYRDLMDEWKAAPRASRKEDDALWARFRAAQDVFFNARKSQNEEIDREYGENLKVKEEILAEGQKLLPVKDVKAARKVLNDLRGRWEDAGRVPRKDVSRMEAAFRKLEDGLKSAEDDHWRQTNPETKARTNSALSQLEDKVAELADALAKAQAQGNASSIAKAQEALEARKMWLETLQKSAQGLR